MRLLVLWPTSRRNLRRRYCYAACVPPADMDISYARSAIDGMKRYAFENMTGQPASTGKEKECMP